MAHANLQKSDLLRLLGLTFTSYMKLNDYIKSIARSAPKKFVPCVVLDIFSRPNISYTFSSLPFVHSFNIAATSGLALLLCT